MVVEGGMVDTLAEVGVVEAVAGAVGVVAEAGTIRKISNRTMVSTTMRRALVRQI